MSICLSVSCVSCYCSQQFEVDGQVEETGFDFLDPVARKNIIIHAKPVQNWQDQSRNEPSISSHVHSAGGAGSSSAIDSALQNNSNETVMDMQNEDDEDAMPLTELYGSDDSDKSDLNSEEELGMHYYSV